MLTDEFYEYESDVDMSNNDLIDMYDLLHEDLEQLIKKATKKCKKQYVTQDDVYKIARRVDYWADEVINRPNMSNFKSKVIVLDSMVYNLEDIVCKKSKNNR